MTDPFRAAVSRNQGVFRSLGGARGAQVETVQTDPPTLDGQVRAGAFRPAAAIEVLHPLAAARHREVRMAAADRVAALPASALGSPHFHLASAAEERLATTLGHSRNGVRLVDP